MISVAKAHEAIISRSSTRSYESVKLEDSIGHILRQKVFAERNQPPFNRVAMDGICIQKNSFEAGLREFKIENIQKAGSKQLTLIDKNCCLEVMTGAVLPKNANAVIRYEDIVIENGIAKITANLILKDMHNVHPLRKDYAMGELLIEEGTKITSPIIATLASQGTHEVKVSKIPKIAIIATGDELVNFNQTPLPHQIRKSNPYALQAELRTYGFNKTELFHIKDNKEEVASTLISILKEFDTLILSGGVSMGKFDFVPETLKELNIKKVFHKITQKPGKPFWFGHSEENKNVFALPGNPVSCLICLRRYIIPALLTSQGKRAPVPILVKLKESITFKKDFTLFKPVTTTQDDLGVFHAVPINDNGSGDFMTLGKSDGFIQLDKACGELEFKKDQLFPFYPWGSNGITNI